MNEPLEDWLALAAVARSYRRKFDLARYIHSRSRTPAIKVAAARVMDSLAEVIDAPLADADVLHRAREAFNVMLGVLDAAVKARSPSRHAPFIGPPRREIAFRHVRIRMTSNRRTSL